MTMGTRTLRGGDGVADGVGVSVGDGVADGVGVNVGVGVGGRGVRVGVAVAGGRSFHSYAPASTPDPNMRGAPARSIVISDGVSAASPTSTAGEPGNRRRSSEARIAS